MAVSLSGISPTTGTLNAPGVGSGLDVKSLVDQLMAVEQRPLTLLDATYRDGFLACAGIPCNTPTVPIPAGNRLSARVWLPSTTAR